MAHQMNRLSARSVTALAKQGRHADGGGLYLVIDMGGSKRWSFLFRWHGKLKEMGLGGLKGVPLARARELAAEARALVAAGVNPIEARRQDRPVPTFGSVADDLITSMSTQWRNPKHKAQWEMTLREYAKALRPLSVDRIRTEDVLKALQPIWISKPETASRLRGRIERVLDAAKSLGHRTGENPAAWRGNLKNLLPSAKKLSRGHKFQTLTWWRRRVQRDRTAPICAPHVATRPCGWRSGGIGIEASVQCLEAGTQELITHNLDMDRSG
jgi:hypothetical protein